MFVDKVTKALYNNRRNPVGLAEDGERSSLMSFLTRDFEELEDQLKPENDGKLILSVNSNKRIDFASYHGSLSQSSQSPSAVMFFLRRSLVARIPRAFAFVAFSDLQLLGIGIESGNKRGPRASLYAILHLPDNACGGIYSDEALQELLFSTYRSRVHEKIVQSNHLVHPGNFCLQQRSTATIDRGYDSNVETRGCSHATAGLCIIGNRRSITTQGAMPNEYVACF